MPSEPSVTEPPLHCHSPPPSSATGVELPLMMFPQLLPLQHDARYSPIPPIDPQSQSLQPPSCRFAIMRIHPSDEPLPAQAPTKIHEVPDLPSGHRKTIPATPCPLWLIARLQAMLPPRPTSTAATIVMDSTRTRTAYNFLSPRNWPGGVMTLIMEGLVMNTISLIAVSNPPILCYWSR